MGQKKSVDKNESTIDKGTLDKYSEMLHSITGHYMQLTITTSKENDNSWEAGGTMEVGSTLDGKHWGKMSMGAKSYDVNSDSALATVMVALNNYINSPEFVIEMGTRMEKALLEEPNVLDNVSPNPEVHEQG